MPGRPVALLGAIVCTIAFAVLPAATAPAIVPPKDCGFLSVGGKRYNIKADQLACTTARRYSKNYLISVKRKPVGYRCTRYKSTETRLKFRCVKGARTFFAIRR